MQPLHDAIEHLRFHAPTLPIVANLTGQLAQDDDYDARYWCRHLREPVQFHDGAQALRALNIDVCLELGPDGTLVNLLTASGSSPAVALASLRRGARDRATMLSAVDTLHRRGQPLAWKEVLAVLGPMRGASPRDRMGLARLRTKAKSRPPRSQVTHPARPQELELNARHAHEIRDHLLSELRTAMQTPTELDPARSLSELSIDSLTALVFQGRIERRYAIKVPFETITAEVTLAALLDHLVARIAGAGTDVRRGDDRRVA